MKQIFCLLAVILFLSSCDDKNNYVLNRDKNYQKSQLTMEETEKRNPDMFLTARGNSRKNFIRQTVILGKVYNNARIVTYKDIELKLSFYSKTGALLEEDNETVYEKVIPGGAVSFKSKYFTPKGTDSIAMKVTAAKY